MKRSMKKFMATCAAVTAIAAVSSVSALAADYAADTNSATYTVPTADADSQMTVLVVPKGADVTDENIYYIDQDAALSGNALLKGESLADGTYLVKVGYYADGVFSIAEEEFVVGSIGGETREILLGDVANPKGITAIDAQQVLKYSATGEAGFASDADKLIAADVAKPAGITAIDAQQILKYAASGQESQNVGKIAVVDASGAVIEIK